MIGFKSGSMTEKKNHSAHKTLDPSTGELRLEKYPCVDLVSLDEGESTTQGLSNAKKRVWRDTNKQEWLNIYQEYMQKRLTRQPKPLEFQGYVDKDIIVGKNGFRNAGTVGKPFTQTSPKVDDIKQNSESINAKSAKTVRDLRRFPKHGRSITKLERIAERNTKKESEYLLQRDSGQNKDRDGLDRSRKEDELREHELKKADKLPQNLQDETIANDLVNYCDSSDISMDEELSHHDLVEPEADEVIYLNLIESDAEDSDPDIKVEENADIVESKDIGNLEEDNNSGVKKKITYKRRKHNKLRYNTLKLLKYSNICLFKWTKHCFLCYECPEWFNDMQTLRNHVEDSHGRDEIVRKALKEIQVLYHADITDLECRICSSTLNNLGELANHLEGHEIRLKSCGSSLVPYRLCTDEFICQLCGQEFVTRYRLKKHMDGHYLNYVCRKCNKIFPSSGALKSHSQIHIEDVKEIAAPLNFNKYKCRSKGRPIISAIARFKCSHCPAKFRTDYKRLQHLIEEHNTESKLFQCEFCPKIFMTVHWLMKHMNYVHKDELYS